VFSKIEKVAKIDQEVKVNPSAVHKYYLTYLTALQRNTAEIVHESGKNP
jgi:hypothetical protein